MNQVKEKADKNTRLYASTKKRVDQMALDNECSAAEIIDRLSLTGVPIDPTKLPKSDRLSAPTHVDVVITAVQNQQKYFITGNGLYIWNSFTNDVLPKAKASKKGTAFSLDSFDLTKDSSDEQIEAGLVSNHLFSESDVCAVIAQLIKENSDTLLKNGYANIFYLKKCVVDVDWSGDEWGVGAWQRGDLRWRAGYRVFSPSN